MQRLSAEFLTLFVQQTAASFSRERKLGRFTREFLDGIQSTPEEMLNDMLDARAFLVLKILDQEMRLGHLDSEAYQLLESTWLRRVKQMKAFFIWKVGGTGSREGDFHQASREIRGWLLRRSRADSTDFQKVQDYLREHYLDAADGIDENKLATNRLIAEKARRIWQTTGETCEQLNWFRAKLYVTMFYQNIIGAVLESDLQKTATILKAFEFSKAPENRYLLTNGFEAAIAIDFLNKDIIREILRKPELFDFSMVPVEGWPEHIGVPPRYDKKFRYDKEDKQIIYEGVMDQKERDSLLAELQKEEHKIALHNLFQQAAFRPFEDMIL